MATIYPKAFFKQVKKRVQKASCFVLMPFNPKMKEVYGAIKEALGSDFLNIECNRADDFHQPHIIETILKGIAEAEFVIADLTKSNANVFYELGLAHCIKDIDKVIILTQDMKYVPFDLRQFRCIIYEQSITGLKELGNELIKTFKEVAKNSFRLKILENNRKLFSKSLLGNGNSLYSLEFESPVIGLDAIKLQIHFTQLAVDKSKTKLETQYLYLSNEKPEDDIDHIPWKVTLIKINDKEATISIDKTIKTSNARI